jgi:D-alanyl-D-alanine-carboxypeptidase/D-alanyl-D-alanine-endopeptidase
MHPTLRYGQMAVFALATAIAAPTLRAQALDLKTDPNKLAAETRGTQPGSVTVGIARGKDEVFGVSGESGAEAGQPVLYEIGSISKVFTGLLLAQAVEKGELSLDDNLGKLLAGQVAMQPEVAAITLRQLVTHSSCLPRLPEGAWTDEMRDPYRNVDRAMLWDALAKTKLKQAAPCAGDYSNYGFAVLGETLSVHYKKPWETLVIERIAAPLDMKDTLQHLGGKQARLAKPWRGDKEWSPWEFQSFAGAGALRSTAPDMLKFGRAMLAGRNGPLGAAAERAVQPLGRMAGLEIGYAVMMRGPAERRTYFHGGATGAYRAHWMVLPDTNEVLVVLSANSSVNIEKVADAVLSERYKLAKPSSPAVAVANPAEYNGVYRINPKMAMSFVAQNGIVYGRMTGQLFNPLAPTTADAFIHEKASAEFSFRRENGKIVGVTLRQRGNTIEGKRTGEAGPTVAMIEGITQEAFGGRYRMIENGEPAEFEVRAREGQLLVKLEKQPMVGVQPVAGKPDRFAYDVVEAEIQFERGEDKKVSALVLYQNGKVLRAERQAAQ